MFNDTKCFGHFQESSNLCWFCGADNECKALFAKNSLKTSNLRSGNMDHINKLNELKKKYLSEIEKNRIEIKVLEGQVDVIDKIIEDYKRLKEIERIR